MTFKPTSSARNGNMSAGQPLNLPVLEDDAMSTLGAAPPPKRARSDDGGRPVPGAGGGAADDAIDSRSVPSDGGTSPARAAPLRDGAGSPVGAAEEEGGGATTTGGRCPPNRSGQEANKQRGGKAASPPAADVALALRGSPPTVLPPPAASAPAPTEQGQPPKKLASWDERFEELAEFRRRQGHCVVSQRDGKLGKWVQYQRAAYRRKREGKASPLTDERELKLECLGFVWKVRKYAPHDAWEERYNELCEHKMTYGHCAVPQRQGKLGIWVKNQRKEYVSKKEGLESYLSDEREMKLDRIGFAWQLREPLPADTWELSYNDLIEYKGAHGHCSVPQRDEKLGNWVHSQRQEYRKKLDGKKSTMSDEREAKLNSIGFVWKVERNRKGQRS